METNHDSTTNAPEPQQAAATPPDVVDAEMLEPSAGGSLEPYVWGRATIQLHITIHPEDGHDRGRLVSVAAWTHRDAPVTDAVRRQDLGTLPPVAVAALKTLQAEFPERERLARERRSLRAQAAVQAEQERAARKTAAKPAKPPTTHKAPGKPTPPKPAAAGTTASAAPAPAGEAQSDLFTAGG